MGAEIRLDIDSVGHGIETVTITHVGTAATRTEPLQAGSVGTTHIEVHDGTGFAVGDKMIVGIPSLQQTVTITAVGTSGGAGIRLDFTPALTQPYPKGMQAIDPDSGFDVADPLRFNHAANLPFSDRGPSLAGATCER